MTFEFNSGDKESNDFPNPFRIENIFLLLSATVLAAGAVSVLITARGDFQQHSDKVATVCVALATALFGTAVKFLIQALAQMRFYLGRKSPVGLADELPVGQVGFGEGAEQVIDALTQNAIDFPEPQGPLNGVLYSLIKPLVTSPPPIQAAAAQHFHGLVAMSGILLSMTASYFFTSGTAHEGLISWMYLPMTGLSLLTPFMQSKESDFASIDANNAGKMFLKLIGLVTFAILAPVVVPRYMPALHIPPLWIAPLLLLLTSMTASVIFLLSLFAQIDDVRETAVSTEQTTISMNCHPQQLWPKVDRDMQSNWVRGIPNRSYANVPPGTREMESGAFQGYILQETQPTPSITMAMDSLKEAVGTAHTRYLVVLAMWGALLSVVAASVSSYFAPQFSSMERMQISRVVLTVIALGGSTVLAFRIGHLLWSRMYFKSKVTLIVIDGTFQSGEVRIGNQFSGNVQSVATVTRVEDATLRVRAAEMVTVAFGKDGKRFIMAMSPADGYAKTTADGLKQFAAGQSSITAPTSGRDLERARSIAALNAQLAPGAAVSALEGVAGNHIGSGA